MPNHYHNTLHIEGISSHITKFLHDISVEDETEINALFDTDYLEKKYPRGLIDKLIPMPEGLRSDNLLICKNPLIEMANILEFGYKNSLEWQYETWGVKWGDYDTRLVDCELGAYSYLEFEFDTAWGPPEKALLKLSIMYPTLKFSHSGYDECQDVEDSITTIYTDGKIS